MTIDIWLNHLKTQSSQLNRHLLPSLGKSRKTTKVSGGWECMWRSFCLSFFFSGATIARSLIFLRRRKCSLLLLIVLVFSGKTFLRFSPSECLSASWHALISQARLFRCWILIPSDMVRKRNASKANEWATLTSELRLLLKPRRTYAIMTLPATMLLLSTCCERKIPIASLNRIPNLKSLLSF